MKEYNFDRIFTYYVHTQKRKASVNMDITYRCPLQCPFCMRQRKDGKEKIKVSSDMSMENFQKIVAEYDHFHACGQISDPIYHPKFLDFIKYVYQFPNKKFKIHTNGSRKKEDWWKYAYSYSSHNTTWIFGIDGTDQETAEKYRVNIDFHSAFNAMIMGAKLNKNIVWQFIPFRHNEHQIELAKQISLNAGITFKIVRSNRWPKEIDSNIKPPSKKYTSTFNNDSIMWLSRKK